MSRSRTMRQIGVIVICMAIVGSTVTLRAVTAMYTFCQTWDASNPPPDDFWCWYGDWSWTGGYEFNSVGEQEALSRASQLCSAETSACWDTCDSNEYRSHKAWEWSGGSCTYDVSCVQSSANPSCSQGVSGSFSCTCFALNICAPC
jgi:hypothetical protein